MSISNLLKKIPKLGIIGAVVGTGLVAGYEITARLINPKITIADTYTANDGTEFFDAKSFTMTTRDRMDKPAKLSITIERRH